MYVVLLGNIIPMHDFFLQYGGIDTRAEDEMTAESIKKQMTETEWQKVYEMSRDKKLYQNICQSLFPTIYGISQSSKLLIGS